MWVTTSVPPMKLNYSTPTELYSSGAKISSALTKKLLKEKY